MTDLPAADSRARGRGLLRLLKPFAPWILLAIVTGAVAGAATVALLSTINDALHRPEGLAGGLLTTFVALCALSLVTRAVCDMATNVVGQRLVARVRRDLARKILSAPIDALEQYRTHRLMPVLTQDVDMISDVIFGIAPTAIALVTTIGCLVYLASLSLPLFLLLVAALVIGTAIQAFAQVRGVAGFWKAREFEEALHKCYRAISEGAKELRMHRVRRAGMFSGQIEQTIERIRDVNSRAINTFVMAMSFSSALYFLLIALLLGWAAFRPTEPGVLSGFVLVLLFMKGPVDQLLGVLPELGRAKVAFQRIADLSERFANPEPHLHLARPGGTLSFEQAIELRGVRFAYGRAPADDGEATAGSDESLEREKRTESDARAVARPAPAGGFVVGPVDLRLVPGEMVFIVGDNGSGKTTLIKLLLGLYVPRDGEIVLDGKAVTSATRDDYRQLFTTVFSDYYLFEDLVAEASGIGEQRAVDEAARPHLERLEIDHKVTLDGTTFSTVDLSTGQRKRLALVHAYLEGRSVMVFDEWAADQDPTFRRIFYTEILPELRDKGHLLVVVSHDDRYFHVADRIVRLDQGRVVEDLRVEATTREANTGEAKVEVT